MTEKFQYILAYQEEPCVEGALKLRLDVGGLRDYYYSLYSEQSYINVILEATVLLGLVFSCC